MMKFRAKIHCLGGGFAEPHTVKLATEVEFYFPTRVYIMNDYFSRFILQYLSLI